jgi:hypothetical protein
MAVGAAPAHAGLGSPFGSATWSCPSDLPGGSSRDGATTTGPVSKRYKLPVVRITGDGDGGAGGSASLD